MHGRSEMKKPKLDSIEILCRTILEGDVASVAHVSICSARLRLKSNVRRALLRASRVT
jgi:hypothetical protein